jgi:ATP-binding cassette subfamily B protein
VSDAGSPPRPDARSGARHLGTALRTVWSAAPAWLIGRTLLAVAAGVLPVTTAWLTKIVLDRLAGAGPNGLGELLAPVLALAVAGVALVALPQVTQYAEAELGRAAGLRTRQRLYEAVGRLAGLARFEDPRFHDRLQIAVANGPSSPVEVVGSALGIAQGAFSLAGFLGTLAVLNPWMVLIVLLAAVPTLHAELALGRRRASMMWRLARTNRREYFYADLLTSVTAAKEVRLFGLGGLFGTRMIAELRQINSEQRRMDRRELVVQSVIGLLGAVVAGAGLIWAVLAAGAGRLSIGDVSVFIAAVAGVQAGLSVVISGIGRGQQALLMFDHLQAVVTSGPDLLPPPTGKLRTVPPLRRGIALRDVWFRHGDDLPWVLRGVDLSIPAGRSTALVGLNGAGKSTLVKLLCRLYDPTRGAVLWDGVDLRELPVEELRKRIGVVFQDFMEYDLSAAENIGVGDVGTLGDRGRVTAAARRAGSDETLRRLPHGYDTLLTRIYTSAADRDDPSTGVVLSGGQWQRIALARAFMRDSCDLLILDEPSAGLDAEAEYEVHTRLRTHRSGRTSLLISHRLSTVRDADAIVVLADGMVAERGGHGDLLAAQGSYARLFGLQANGYREELVR